MPTLIHAQLLFFLGVRVATSINEQNVVNAFANDIEAAYQSVSNYSKFERATTAASEGYFIGYKHNNAVAEALLLTKASMFNTNTILFVRNSSLNDGTWSAYKLGTPV